MAEDLESTRRENLKEICSEDDEMTQKILRTQLKELSVAEDGSSAISTISAIEDILQKYEAANGVMSIDLVENVAIEKLPDRIAMEIIKKKMESETWDISALRQLLRERQKILELVEFYKENSRSRSGRQNRASSKPCVFCTGDHCGQSCTVYVSLPARIKRLQELNLCEKCYRRKHITGRCRSGIFCSYCQTRSHNIATCPANYKFENYQSVEETVTEESSGSVATSTNSETKDQKCNSENATKSEATELPMKTADAANATTKAVKVKRKKSRERFPDVEAKLAEMMPEVKIKEPDGTIVRFKPKIAIRRDNLYKIITKIRLREDGMYDLETVLGSTVVDSKWVDNYYQTKRRLSSESSSSEETETPNDVISK